MPSAVPIEPVIGKNMNKASKLPRKLTQSTRTVIFLSDLIPQDHVILPTQIYDKLFSSNKTTNDFVVLNSPSSNKWTLFAVLPHNQTLFSNQTVGQLQSQYPPDSCIVSAHSRYALSSLSGVALVRSTVPPVLDQVLVLCSPEIYTTLHQKDHSSLVEIVQSSGSIIRQGEFCSALGGLVKLCDPVDQGIVDPQVTKVTIVKDKSLPALPTTPQSPQLADQISAQPAFSDTPDQIDAEISRYLDFVNDWSSQEDNLESSILNSLPNGSKLDDSKNEPSTTPPIFSKSITIKPLEKPIHPAAIIPTPFPKDDPEARGFAKIEFLAEMGCFSGDVVLIKTATGQRHITLFSYPEPNTSPSRTLYVPPVLFYNLGSPSEIQIAKLSAAKIDTTKARETSYTGYLQTAKEVTISRIASAITTDRTLQVAFLSGLRTYFESSFRVVKHGDIIVIPIDTILAKTLDGIDDAGAIPVGRPNEVAWFKVTALNSTETASDNDESLLTDDNSDYIINPSQTRMVQSGLVMENSIPSNIPWKQYLSLPLYPHYNLDDHSSSKFEYARRLHQYFSASISPLGVSLKTTILVHSSKRGTGKSSTVHSVAASMGIHVFEVDGFSIISDNDAKTFGILRARLERASEINPCIVLIKHIDAFAKKSEQDGKEGAGITSNIINLLNTILSERENLIITATAADVDKLSDSVRALFNFEVEIGVPSEDERRDIFSYISKTQLPDQVSEQRFGQVKLPYTFALRGDVSIDTLALQSAGLTPPDLISIVQTSKQKALGRLKKVSKESSSELFDFILSSGGVIKITPEDIEDAIGEARRKYSDSIGAPRIPNVSWEDVGGLEGVKKEILDTIEMPLKYPELFSGGMKKRSGILFYGPPGTGKTLLAKAIATTFSLNFFSVKGPELLNMYIGESEANVRKVFQKARDARPCVVFFDELDSVAPKRGNQGDSGGVMDRIVSQLLAELDGMSGGGGEGVFVVGATNRPDLLDEALLRPGRFDKMLYLGVSDTHAKQQTILEALTRKFKLSEDVSLANVANKCPFTYTGADFYALCSDAILNAMTRTAGEVDEKYNKYNLEERNAKGLKEISIRWWFENIATDKDIDVLVTEADFDKSLRELIPSVSADELRHYMRVRDNFQGGKTKAKSEAQKAERGRIEEIDDIDGILSESIKQAIGEATRQIGSLNINGSNGSSDLQTARDATASSTVSETGTSLSTPVANPDLPSINGTSEQDSQDQLANGNGIANGNGSSYNGISNGSGESGKSKKKNKGKGISKKH